MALSNERVIEVTIALVVAVVCFHVALVIGIWIFS